VHESLDGIRFAAGKLERLRRISHTHALISGSVYHFEPFGASSVLGSSVEVLAARNRSQNFQK